MKQEYEKYTTEDHKVWSLLYSEQMNHLPDKITKAYLNGIKTVKFQEDKVPVFNVINEELSKTTGWKVYVVPGLIDNKPFFEHLSKKEFPCTTWLRKMSQLTYIEEPDMFHDVFGHVPLLSEQFFCDFLQSLSKITLKHIDNPTVVELSARLYWYTVEFGLIREDGKVKIYGAGLTSSPGESKYCVSKEAVHVPYDVRQIFETPYIKDKFQEKYFVIESYEQLYDSLTEIEEEVEKYVSESITIEPSYA